MHPVPTNVVLRAAMILSNDTQAIQQWPIHMMINELGRRGTRQLLQGAPTASPGSSRSHLAPAVDSMPGHSYDYPASLPENGRETGPGQVEPKLLVPLGGWPKRLTDVAIAAAALLLAAPLMAMIMLLIRTTSRGSIFFAHTRIGFRGRPFKCYKFRTMMPDAHSRLCEHLAGNSQAALEWQETQKLRNDPRINFVGHLLRKSSLDELPQFYNVLRGDMSCVGPRPIVLDELERYGTFAEYYLSTRPGLTGLWQVTGRSATDYAKRVTLDTQYVRTWSLWSDLIILFRTPVAVTRISTVH